MSITFISGFNASRVVSRMILWILDTSWEFWTVKMGRRYEACVFMLFQSAFLLFLYILTPRADFQISFQKFKTITLEMSTSPNEPGSGANWIAFCVIQSKSSNISRHQIFTEGDTAQVRQSHSGRQDRASRSSGSLRSSREEVQITPTIIMQVAKCSAGGGQVLERMCRHRRISLPGPGNSPSMYKPGAESYLSLSYKLVINIHEDSRNCVLPYA